MKKTIAILLTAFMFLGLAACGNSANNAGQSATDRNSVNPVENNATDKSDSTENVIDGAKVLVAYFSATNTTKGVAENLADGLGADLYAIVPETPYTDADLDYHDDNSRTTIEMNDPNVRPAISDSVESSVLYLGRQRNGKQRNQSTLCDRRCCMA